MTSPGITDLIDLPYPTGGSASPSGRRVAYLVSQPNWTANRHELRCFVHDRDQNRSAALTRRGSVSQLRWLGEDSLALLKQDFEAQGEGADAQIWLFEGLVGEGWQVSDHEGGVKAFDRFAEGFVYLAGHPERRKREARVEQFGRFVHQERETSADALYYLSLPRLREYQEQARRCSSDAERSKLPRPVVELSALLPEPLTLSGFAVSPRDDAIYLTCRRRDDLVFSDETFCYRIRLDAEAALAESMRIEQEKQSAGDAGSSSAPDASASQAAAGHLGELTRLALPGAASLGPVSPDGRQILVQHRRRDPHWYTQTDLSVLDVTGSKAELEQGELQTRLRCVTQALDREPLGARWVEAGLYALVLSGTGSQIVHLSEDAPPRALALEGLSPDPGFALSSGGQLCFVGASEDRFREVYTAGLDAAGQLSALERLTDLGQALEGWELGTVETIRWQAQDGTEIEGVLRKPPGYQPGKRYPLVFLVHGGPTWASRALLLDGDDLRYYPSVALATRGVLVLKPNYRGSLGRGQAFQELNAGNLGVGDLWDLEGAIDDLVERGMVDPERVGCMGWSQGGYISAMAGTHSKRFKAVSVGAGISDWYTYHISNDVPQFTTHFLGSSPFDAREIYRRTSPIEGLSEDTAPMLIQHGAKDQRVPLSNAMELFRGLQAKGRPVELFVYPEMAHPITRPRENRAVMWQNLSWFAHHLLGEPLDFFDMAGEKAPAI